MERAQILRFPMQSIVLADPATVAAFYTSHLIDEQTIAACPVVVQHYPVLEQVSLLDCRGLHDNPDRSLSIWFLTCASSAGHKGVIIPLTRTTEMEADVIHSGECGWLVKRDGTWWHIPACEPAFMVACKYFCIVRHRIEADQGYSVLLTLPCREALVSSPFTTHLLAYTDGQVMPRAPPPITVDDD